VIAFPELATHVLGPLEGRERQSWFSAPPGKWCAAQIVEHLAIGLDLSSRGFESRRDKPPMRRRPRSPAQRAAWLLIMGLHWFPPGGKAPSVTQPAPRPEPGEVTALLRAGVDRFLALERGLLPLRAHDLFLKHPVLGDLTLEEWMRFHVIHARHHARQIRRLLA
jgi:hypothetical protein